MTAEELMLRRLLWLHHGHVFEVAEMFKESGGMICGQCQLDFRFDSLQRIEAVLTDNSLYEVAKHCCHNQDMPWTDPRTGKTHLPPR